MEITATKFYEEIEKEQEKYKLINGLFIVKYIDSEISVYIGEFLKGKINKVVIYNTNQKFNKNKNTFTTSLGYWRTLNIKFNEQPIKEILKNEI